MTRKDYEAIAAILRAKRDEIESDRATARKYRAMYRASAHDTVDDIQERFVSLLAADNPRFNATQFREACK